MQKLSIETHKNSRDGLFSTTKNRITFELRGPKRKEAHGRQPNNMHNTVVTEKKIQNFGRNTVGRLA